MAFLDIHPESKGHVLVIPKIEIDKIYELPDDVYSHLMKVVKVLSVHLEEKMNSRTLLKVVGTDVPHAHVHLMPLDEDWKYGKTLELEASEMEEIRKKLEYTDKI